MTDLILLFNAAGFSAALLLVLVVQRHNLDELWTLINSAIVVAAALAYWFEWHGAGYVLAGASMLFVIAPLVLVAAARALMRRDRKNAGLRLYRFAVILHPAPAWRLMAALEEAALSPTIADHTAALDRVIKAFPAYLTTTAKLMRLRLLNDWHGILAIEPHSGTRQLEPFHRMLTIRALGETGRLNEMVEAFLAEYDMLATALLLNQTLLGVVQFTGRVDALPFLMSQPEIKAFSEEQRRWVENITHLVAGDASARARLRELTDRTGDPEARRIRQERLDTPYADPAHTLRPELGKALDDFIARRMTRAADIHGRRQPLAWATYALIAANAAVFTAELSMGNPESTRVLMRLGALWPPYVMAGSWWRLGSALFLHAGWAHLLFNMAMLLMLGQSYERRNGLRALLILYGLGGLASMAAVLGLMWWDYVPMNVLVGASGAIFALFGGQIVDLIGRWRKTGMKEDRNALFLVFLCLALQVVFDNIVPAVSFSAHVSGFFAGLAIGVILSLLRR